QTGRAALVTDAEGEDALEIHSLDGSEPPRRLLAGQLGRVLHLASDPAGQRLGVISHDGAIRLVTLADGSVREVWRSHQGEALTPSFSPDGRYLIWSQPTTGEAELHQVMLLDTSAADGKPLALTSGHYHDRCPQITMDGKYLV